MAAKSPRASGGKNYASCLPALRDALLHAQVAMQQDKQFAIALIVTGVPAAGRSETVNQFLEWMDPKHIKVHALAEPKKLARLHPPLWKFWNSLPARGEVAIYFDGWYEDYLRDAMSDPKKLRRHEKRTVARIRQLEAMLIRDRVRVVKLHLHIDAKLQKTRIEALRDDRKTRWRVTDDDLWLVRHHGKVDAALRHCVTSTNSPVAPWNEIDGSDPDRRAFETGTLLLQEIELGFKRARQQRNHKPATTAPEKAITVYPSHQDGPDISDDEYDSRLEKLQGQLALLSREHAFARRGAVLAFEGMDAAGKGGAIRRLTGALDARQYKVVPVSAPSPEEFARPYLWRFWREVPVRGQITIYDRSWYGRVLVERVRDLAAEADWRRAYDEINEFELQLTEHKIVVHKFWLVVGKDEQLSRFNERDKDPLKAFKVDPEDWANRRFYDDYQRAASDMIERTNTKHAPWTVVAADDKKFARLQVLEAVCESFQRALD
jgi:polyphosphate:AMP phosphotransferase